MVIVKRRASERIPKGRNIISGFVKTVGFFITTLNGKGKCFNIKFENSEKVVFKDSSFLKSTVETINLVWQEAAVLNPFLLLYFLGCLFTAHC